MGSFDFTKNSKIFVAGHRGLVGSATVRVLKQAGYNNIIVKARSELDLTNLESVSDFFSSEKPEVVVLAAAKVGGIGANSTFPVEFLLENLKIQNAVISKAAEFGTKKLVFLGSSCIYPKTANYPITPDQFLTGPFEPTNEAYALAKSTGLRLCQYYAKQYQKNFISLMPTNLFGPGDFYDMDKSHVIPAMLLKVLRAQKEKSSSVTFWGSGRPMREFLYSDDLARAILTCIEKYDSPEIINIGSEQEVSIRELAEVVCRVCGFSGEICWETSQPDGVMRKVMNSSVIRELGWKPKVSLEEGLRNVLDEARMKL